MSRLHPVFNVVKLTPAPDNPILGHHPRPPPLPEIINGVEEWIVEKILDSWMINRKLRYLVKWEGFGIEHNSWEPANDVHALERVAEFYWKFLPINQVNSKVGIFYPPPFTFILHVREHV